MSSQEELKSSPVATTVSGKFNQCDRKCQHQGDRICYGDEPEKEIVKTIPEEPIAAGSTESIDSESIHSGESIYKTFKFDIQDSDPDMEKCMRFWKGILAKNVKPMKCTLLKPRKDKEKLVKEKKLQKKNVCKHPEEIEKMWLDIYKDLQRRRLDQTKLVKKKVCDPCAEYIDEEYEKEAQKEDSENIKKLNKWKSHRQPTTKIDVQSQVKRTLQVLQATASNRSIKSRESVTDVKASSPISNPESKQSVTTAEAQTTKSSSSKDSKPSQSLRTAGSKDISKTSVSITSEIPTPLPQEPATKVPSKSSVTVESIVKTNEPETCHKCGCDIEECICSEMRDLGIADEARTCPCGCSLDQCTCDPCSCGCGFKECICDQYSNSCRCGNEDCRCDLVEVLSSYLETAHPPTEIEVSHGTQTEEVVATTQESGAYCIICGHFDCYCKL